MTSGRYGLVLREVGRPAKKWSVLELKREGPAPNDPGGIDDLRSAMIQDGDLIHLYDEKTGEWAHIDIKDDK